MFNKSQFKPAFVTALVAICVAFGESVKLETTLTNKQYTVEVKLTPRQQKKKERKEKQKAQKQRNDSARSVFATNIVQS